jgi:hypothetical protein
MSTLPTAVPPASVGDRRVRQLARESAAVMVVSAGLSAALAVGLTLLAHLGR